MSIRGFSYLTKIPFDINFNLYANTTVYQTYIGGSVSYGFMFFDQSKVLHGSFLLIFKRMDTHMQNMRINLHIKARKEGGSG